MTPLPPGSTIGILGSGQLGRMLAVAAAQLGYRTHIYAPESGPACDVASKYTQGVYLDRALLEFAKQIDVATFEFENVPAMAIGQLAGQVRTRPTSYSLDVSGNRLNEKSFAARYGGVTAAYRGVRDLTTLRAALAQLGAPAILKTAQFGYDGKGQFKLSSVEEVDEAWTAIGAPSGTYDTAILEQFVPFDREFSVIACRSDDGAFAVWDTPLNVHQGGILRESIVSPGSLPDGDVTAAVALTQRMADRLGHVGVLACEFFATKQGPVFNEMAPRVHNSGHWTVEGAVTSQFENHIRAICGLPLGSTALTGQSVLMRNLIGDQAEDWPAILTKPDAHLHLYGKGAARPGRKMGHVTTVRR